MISPELHAQIRRLFYAEHWRLNTIAAQLGLHHDTVRRAVESERFIRPGHADPPERARSLQGLHHRHARAVSAPARHAAVGHGTRARLSRLGDPGPALRAHRAARRPRGGLSSPRHAPRRASPSRLGQLRADPRGLDHAAALLLRPRTVLVARLLRALRPRSDAREFSARPRRGVHRARRACPARSSTTI